MYLMSEVSLKLVMKSSKKFLLLGHNGYLGNFLHNELDCDILDSKDVYCNGKDYEFIVNCISKTSVPYCEENPDLSLYSNAEVVLDIKKFYPKSFLINFSSYYVYDDINLCTENSKTNNKLVYCKHKLLSENYNDKGVNFRVGKLFGNKNAFQYRLTEKVLDSDEIWLDQVNMNPTSVYCISEIIKKIDVIKDFPSTYNLANHGITSHFDYGSFIVNHLKRNTIIHKLNSYEKPFSSHGNFLMSLDKISKFYDIKSWQEDMIYYLDNL